MENIRGKVSHILIVGITVGFIILAFAWLFAFCVAHSVEYEVSTARAATATPIPAKILPFPPSLAPKTINDLTALIDQISGHCGANPAFVNFVVKKESNFDPDAVGDKDFVCNLPRSPLYGKISPSYGLGMINRCAHPNITIASATDPVFAINFIAQSFVQGTENKEFSTWRMRCKWYQDSPNCGN